MESLSEIMKEKYKTYAYKLEKNYNDALETNPTFASLTKKLALPKAELMKYTSKLEDTAKELDHCRNCKSIYDCPNGVSGYVCFPSVSENNLVFSYIPCKYRKALSKKESYQKNIYAGGMPKYLLQASMKDIHTDDKKRYETIKWIKKFLDNYKSGEKNKGLYLNGNFGCGKTYLLCAMLNELAKKNIKVAVIYYPELLRKIKETFNSDEDSTYLNKIKKIEILLLDDIGAETTTPWSRDEVLGTILQYRMDEGLTTFFTSNLTLEELEEHLGSSNKGVEKVKARRIIERIKQLTDNITMISENKRKWGKNEK